MISSFKDEFSFLSNFFEAPIVFRNLDFRNSEAAYQTCKMWGCVNTSQFCSMTGSQAKKAGKLIPTEQMDPDWDKNRLSVMSEIIHCKFL
jgi:predicted NAD-dependent protein-ADP-ribosyltransferase YbiA (DUF1768 family)